MHKYYRWGEGMRIKYVLIILLCATFLMGCSSEPVMEDGFEQAVHEKYDSFASENGLDGTLIFVEGVITKIYDEYESFILSSDDGDWVVSYVLAGDEYESQLVEIGDRPIKVYGVYIGKSETLQVPSIAMTNEKSKIVDAEDGTIILDFWDYSEAGLKGEWNAPDMSAEKVIGNIAYLEPINWEYNEKKNDDSSYLYYYPYPEKSSGMLYIYVSESASNVNYPSAFKSMLTGEDVVQEENDEVIAGEKGYYARYTHIVDDVPYEVSVYLINTDTNYIAFMFSEINSLSDNMEDFSEEFMSHVVTTESAEYKLNRIDKIQEENTAIVYGEYNDEKEGKETDFYFSAKGIVSDITTYSSGEVMWFEFAELTDDKVFTSTIWIDGETGTKNLAYGESIVIYGYVNKEAEVEIYGYEKTEISYSLDNIISTYKNTCSSYTYEEIARNPENVRGKNAKLSGKVVQVLQDGNDMVLRVNINGNYNQTVYVVYSKKTQDEDNILEGDNVSIYGELAGTKTYTTVLGGSMTIPQIYAEYIVIK